SFGGNAWGGRGRGGGEAAQPPIPSRVRVPTVASRPTINRHMASLRSEALQDLTRFGRKVLTASSIADALVSSPLSRTSTVVGCPRTGRRLSSKLHIESRRFAAMKAR